MPMGNNPRTVTSANAILMLRCKGVFDNYVQLQGFQADNAWTMGESNIGQTEMGVDGFQSIGYKPQEVPVTIYLMANSPSVAVFDAIMRDFNSNKEVRYVELRQEISSVGKSFYGKGGVVSIKLPDVKSKVEGAQMTLNMVINGAEEI